MGLLHIEVEFLHGVFRGDPDGSASTGALHLCEWPPSPARLFAAFVAADGTGERCAVTNGEELNWLEGLAPPNIHACGNIRHNPMRPRFVVEAGKPAAGAVMEYIGKKSAEARPGPKAAMRERKALYTYDIDADAAAVQRNIAALQLRAARIGYLGASDSPVHVRVRTEAPDDAHGLMEYTPDPSGDVKLCAPAPGTLAALDAAFEQWTAHGPHISRQHFPLLSRKASYKRDDAHADAPLQVGAVIAWLRLDRPVSGRRMRQLTRLFKQAVLSAHEKTLGFGEPDPLLHGHVSADKGYDLARYLALPNVQGNHSDGRIHGLALWLPPGASDGVRAKATAAALAVCRLFDGEIISVTATSNMPPANRPWSAHPDRWTQAGCAWSTATPIVHERRGDVGLSEVTDWCRHAGYPDPVSFSRSRAPYVNGGLRLAPVEVHGEDRSGHPYSHFIIRFAKTVRGPVVLGKGRQMGFGLCIPLPDGDSE